MTTAQTYYVSHGNIAGIQYVSLPNGGIVDCIYIGPGDVQALYPQGKGFRFDQLPVEVRAAVIRQFDAVFSLPVEKRGEWVRAQTPFPVVALGV